MTALRSGDAVTTSTFPRRSLWPKSHQNNWEAKTQRGLLLRRKDSRGRTGSGERGMLFVIYRVRLFGDSHAHRHTLHRVKKETVHSTGSKNIRLHSAIILVNPTYSNVPLSEFELQFWSGKVMVSRRRLGTLKDMLATGNRNENKLPFK